MWCQLAVIHILNVCSLRARAWPFKSLTVGCLNLLWLLNLLLHDRAYKTVNYVVITCAVFWYQSPLIQLTISINHQQRNRLCNFLTWATCYCNWSSEWGHSDYKPLKWQIADLFYCWISELLNQLTRRLSVKLAVAFEYTNKYTNKSFIVDAMGSRVWLLVALLTNWLRTEDDWVNDWLELKTVEWMMVDS